MLRLRYHVDDERWSLGDPLGIAYGINIISPHINPQVHLSGDQRVEIPTDRAGSLVGQVGSARTIAELILDHPPTIGDSQIGHHLQGIIAGVLNSSPEDELFSGRHCFRIRGNVITNERHTHTWKV